MILMNIYCYVLLSITIQWILTKEYKNKFQIYTYQCAADILFENLDNILRSHALLWEKHTHLFKLCPQEQNLRIGNSTNYSVCLCRIYTVKRCTRLKSIDSLQKVSFCFHVFILKLFVSMKYLMCSLINVYILYLFWRRRY